jgi:hypothetical protein
MTPQLKNNQISDLPTIPSNRYENIFNVYTVEKDNKNFYFYNINNKIQLPVVIGGDYLDTIVLDRTMPWTTLSYKLYETMNLWYLIYVLNHKDSKPSFTANINDTLVYIKPRFINAIITSLNE